MEKLPLQSELTVQGEQTLMPGVKPITQRERLQALMNAPMLPKKAQKPCNVGLFDDNARAQLDMFIHTRPAAKP